MSENLGLWNVAGAAVGLGSFCGGSRNLSGDIPPDRAKPDSRLDKILRMMDLPRPWEAPLIGRAGTTAPNPALKGGKRLVARAGVLSREQEHASRKQTLADHQHQLFINRGQGSPRQRNSMTSRGRGVRDRQSDAPPLSSNRRILIFKRWSDSVGTRVGFELFAGPFRVIRFGQDASGLRVLVDTPWSGHVMPSPSCDHGQGELGDVVVAERAAVQWCPRTTVRPGWSPTGAAVSLVVLPETVDASDALSRRAGGRA